MQRRRPSSGNGDGGRLSAPAARSFCGVKDADALPVGLVVLGGGLVQRQAVVALCVGEEGVPERVRIGAPVGILPTPVALQQLDFEDAVACARVLQACVRSQGSVTVMAHMEQKQANAAIRPTPTTPPGPIGMWRRCRWAKRHLTTEEDVDDEACLAGQRARGQALHRRLTPRWPAAPDPFTAPPHPTRKAAAAAFQESVRAPIQAVCPCQWDARTHEPHRLLRLDSREEVPAQDGLLPEAHVQAGWRQEDVHAAGLHPRRQADKHLHIGLRACGEGRQAPHGVGQ
jgi:hypothetical protein